MPPTSIARLHDFTEALPAPVRAELEAAGTSRTFRSGGKLLRSGVRPQEVYEVLEGRVKYSTWDHQGREMVLTYMTRGDWVGLSEAFTDLPALWDVIALGPVKVRVVRHRDFLALTDRHPVLARQLLRIFAHRFTLHRLFGLDHSSLSLKERVIKMLYFLSFGHEKEKPDDVPIVLKLSQEELGKVVGASRQKLNPVLRALQAEDLLTVQFGALQLRSRASITERYGHLLIPGL